MCRPVWEDTAIVGTRQEPHTQFPGDQSSGESDQEDRHTPQHRVPDTVASDVVGGGSSHMKFYRMLHTLRRPGHLDIWDLHKHMMSFTPTALQCFHSHWCTNQTCHAIKLFYSLIDLHTAYLNMYSGNQTCSKSDFCCPHIHCTETLHSADWHCCSRTVGPLPYIGKAINQQPHASLV